MSRRPCRLEQPWKRSSAGLCAFSSGERIVDDLEEASDIHWLNSLAGEACLLVDSYGDLGDGKAIAEVVDLIQGHPVPRTGTGSTLSIASALDSLVTNTEWSDLPPRLLQAGFPARVREGEPSACRDVVAFLRNRYLQTLRCDARDLRGTHRGTTSMEKTRSTSVSLHENVRPTGSVQVSSIPTRTVQRPLIRQREAGTHASHVSPPRPPREYRLESRAGGHGSEDRVQPETIRWVNSVNSSASSCYAPPIRTRGDTAATKGGTTTRSGGKNLHPHAGQAAARGDENLGRGESHPESVLEETRSETLDGMSTRGVNPDINNSSSSNNRRTKDASVSLRRPVRQGLPRELGTLMISPRRRDKTMGATYDTDGDRENGIVVGRKGANKEGVSGTISPRHGRAVRTAGGRTRPATEARRGRKVGFPRVCCGEEGLAAAVQATTEKTVGAAGTAGTEQKDNRLDVLRWMDRLGVKVEPGFLEPEKTSCHERLWNGELLCELAAAVDYSFSGGRGLPVVELPSCPGRFVLKGTFGFVPRPHAARARHNVRTALGAFKILGGARGGGAWLGAEAILEGDFEAMWRLLGQIHTAFGRPRATRRHREISIDRNRHPMRSSRSVKPPPPDNSLLAMSTDVLKNADGAAAGAKVVEGKRRQDDTNKKAMSRDVFNVFAAVASSSKTKGKCIQRQNVPPPIPPPSPSPPPVDAVERYEDVHHLAVSLGSKKDNINRGANRVNSVALGSFRTETIGSSSTMFSRSIADHDTRNIPCRRPGSPRVAPTATDGGNGGGSIHASPRGGSSTHPIAGIVRERAASIATAGVGRPTSTTGTDRKRLTRSPSGSSVSRGQQQPPPQPCELSATDKPAALSWRRSFCSAAKNVVFSCPAATAQAVDSSSGMVRHVLPKSHNMPQPRTMGDVAESFVVAPATTAAELAAPDKAQPTVVDGNTAIESVKMTCDAKETVPAGAKLVSAAVDFSTSASLFEHGGSFSAVAQEPSAAVLPSLDHTDFVVTSHSADRPCLSLSGNRSEHKQGECVDKLGVPLLSPGGSDLSPCSGNTSAPQPAGVAYATHDNKPSGTSKGSGKFLSAGSAVERETSDWLNLDPVAPTSFGARDEIWGIMWRGVLSGRSKLLGNFETSGTAATLADASGERQEIASGQARLPSSPPAPAPGFQTNPRSLQASADNSRRKEGGYRSSDEDAHVADHGVPGHMAALTTTSNVSIYRNNGTESSHATRIVGATTAGIPVFSGQQVFQPECRAPGGWGGVEKEEGGQDCPSCRRPVIGGLPLRLGSRALPVDPFRRATGTDLSPLVYV